MPTGYTYPVCEGKISEFPEFAMSCARAFGALITMRDDPMDAPIPEVIAPSTAYFDERITAAERRLDELQGMTAVERETAAQAAYADAMASRQKYLDDKQIEAGRLNAMLGKVRAWVPPTPDHTGLKEFMVQQLTDSLPGDYAPAIPEHLDGQEWWRREVKKTADDLAYQKRERAKEIDRASGRTGWIKALRASITNGDQRT